MICQRLLCFILQPSVENTCLFKKKKQLILLGKVLRAWLFSLSILSKLNSMTNNYIQIARIPTFVQPMVIRTVTEKASKLTY